MTDDQIERIYMRLELTHEDVDAYVDFLATLSNLGGDNALMLHRDVDHQERIRRLLALDSEGFKGPALVELFDEIAQLSGRYEDTWKSEARRQLEAKSKAIKAEWMAT